MGGILQKIVFKSGEDNLGKQGVPNSFFDFKIKDINGKVIDFSEFKKRKAILVVNVACK